MARTPEENREYMRAYYAKNKDKWAKRTPEKQAEYNANRRERYANDPEFRAKYQEWARGRDPAKKRDGRIRSEFGVGVEQYDRMLADQDGKCAICGAESADSRGHKLHIDHCHATGRIRGLLCSNCNHGVGKFKDDPDRLRKAAAYLEAVDRVVLTEC